MNIKTTEIVKKLKKVLHWFLFIYGYLYVLHFLIFLFQIIFLFQTIFLILIIELKFKDFDEFKFKLKANKEINILTGSLGFLGLLVYLSYVYNPIVRLSINIVFISVFSFFLLIFVVPILEKKILIVKSLLEEDVRESDINILKKEFFEIHKKLIKVLLYLLDESESKLLDLLSQKRERKFKIVFVLEYILYSFLIIFIFLSVLDFFFVQWLNIIILFFFIILTIREDFLLKIYECKFRKKRFSSFNTNLKLIYNNSFALRTQDLKEWEIIIKKIKNYNSIKETNINFKNILKKIIPLVSFCVLIFFSFIKIEKITLADQNFLNFVIFLGMFSFILILFYIYPKIMIFRKLDENLYSFYIAEILLESLSALIKNINQISMKETIEYIKEITRKT